MKKRELITWAGEILSGVECQCGKPYSVANHDYCLAGAAQRWLQHSVKILKIHQQVAENGTVRLESKGPRDVKIPGILRDGFEEIK